jgi:serine/threonine protein kinase
MSTAAAPVDVLGLVGSTIDQVRFDACADAGGFGLIYRGYHEGLGETVAIKCLRIASIQKTNQAIREALAGRFRDETKLLYRLSQGNLDIVRCISSGTLVAPATNEYTPYMVLEWLDGCTLSAELKERRTQRLRPRTLEAAVQLLDSAVGGLAYAHAHDVVHRDVKPGNLFLARTREGVRMKVLDFGLAKILSDESIGVRPSVETGIGVHFCSPSYGAPEQFSAQIGKIGPWTDVYSLTLVLYEVLLGEKVRPAGSLADGLLKALDPVTGSPSASSLGLQLPKAVEALLQRAVAVDPKDRPRDAGVFWSELEEAIASSPKPTVAMAPVMAEPAPFTGTMLMKNAPQGAPHLVEAVEPARSTAPFPAPQAGRSPMPSVPPPPGPESVVKARERGDLLKGTLPIGATSPLAASISIPSPLRGTAPGASGPPPAHGVPSAPPPGYGGSQPPPPMSSYPPNQSGVPVNPRDVRTDPRMGTTPPLVLRTKSNAGALVFVVVLVVLAIVGVTFYWVRMR